MRIELGLKALSVNSGFQGRRFKNKLYKQYEIDVSRLLPHIKTITGYIEIHYIFRLVNWKRTDGDNLTKFLTDILVARGIIEDDRFIMKYVIEKEPALEDSILIDIVKIDDKVNQSEK